MKPHLSKAFFLLVFVTLLFFIGKPRPNLFPVSKGIKTIEANSVGLKLEIANVRKEDLLVLDPVTWLSSEEISKNLLRLKKLNPKLDAESFEDKNIGQKVKIIFTDNYKKDSNYYAAAETGMIYRVIKQKNQKVTVSKIAFIKDLFSKPISQAIDHNAWIKKAFRN